MSAAARSSLGRVIAGALGVVLLMAVAASCLIGRKSSEYECSSPDECDTGRTCDQGYCVEAKCPSGCDRCDLIQKTCEINCGQGDRCGGSLCPAGYACTISCTGNNACTASPTCAATARSCKFTCSGNNSCGNVQCANGVPCDVNCATDGACQNIECGAGARCNVMCTGMNACGMVDCQDACACDVTCGAMACGTLTCPIKGGAACTKPGLPDCSSTTVSTCSTCPL